MSTQRKIIPKQKKGLQTGASSKFTATTRHNAVLIFERCKSLLIDVNNWQKLCKEKGAEFCLTDNNGQVLHDQKAIVDAYIRIKLPAPSNPTGDGYDWVRIEAFDTNKDLSKDEEMFGFRVRPAPNPTKDVTETAHFYQDSATSSFLIIRANNTITVMERGKNELPNKDGSLFERIRNWVVAIPAMLGLAIPQWKMLTDGILDNAVQNKNP